MTDQEQKQFLDGLEDGLVPNEIIEGRTNGIKILQSLRKRVGNGTFRTIMHRLVMPNRMARKLEKECGYVETQEQYKDLERRILQSLQSIRLQVKK